ncbi:unnamed protein product [Protopolystoma xenopodis]|uniref:Uncharacterized protein n=1 Tax=Protopolystoma xenopodis TaxID=117903 RepID=A0A448X1Y8_9PLAT|nr:unnamed protein product [Protopolystoma xenopodis]
MTAGQHQSRFYTQPAPLQLPACTTVPGDGFDSLLNKNSTLLLSFGQEVETNVCTSKDEEITGQTNGGTNKKDNPMAKKETR